ncbi:DUF4142 domain-containing protein [Rhodopila sp.]|uniref:DUF4142 domain-containing protein n=1 Tax=Rhodopila sp. TaxID=2480087 RepID=UPI003D0A0722
MNKFRLTLVASACLLAAAPAFAQNGVTLSRQDKQFLRRDAHGSAYEKALSELALQKAASPEIKDFAQRDISAHTQLNQQAQQIAQQNGMTLPGKLTKKQQTRFNHLKSLDSKAFDTAYVQEMKRINQSDRTEDQRELQSTQNAQLKQFVQNGETMDAEHADAAQKLQTANNAVK